MFLATLSRPLLNRKLIELAGEQYLNTMNGIGGGANELCFHIGAVLCYYKDIHNME
jgi:hypothetical protein